MMTDPEAVPSRWRADEWSGSNTSYSAVFPHVVLCDNFATIISG